MSKKTKPETESHSVIPECFSIDIRDAQKIAIKILGRGAGLFVSAENKEPNLFSALVADMGRWMKTADDSLASVLIACPDVHRALLPENIKKHQAWKNIAEIAKQQQNSKNKVALTIDGDLLQEVGIDPWLDIWRCLVDPLFMSVADPDALRIFDYTVDSKTLCEHSAMFLSAVSAWGVHLMYTFGTEPEYGILALVTLPYYDGWLLSLTEKDKWEPEELDRLIHECWLKNEGKIPFKDIKKAVTSSMRKTEGDKGKILEAARQQFKRFIYACKLQTKGNIPFKDVETHFLELLNKEWKAARGAKKGMMKDTPKAVRSWLWKTLVGHNKDIIRKESYDRACLMIFQKDVQPASAGRKSPTYSSDSTEKINLKIPSQSDPPTLMYPPYIAAALGISLSTFAKYVHKNVLPKQLPDERDRDYLQRCQKIMEQKRQRISRSQAAKVLSRRGGKSESACRKWLQRHENDIPRDPDDKKYSCDDIKRANQMIYPSKKQHHATKPR